MFCIPKYMETLRVGASLPSTLGKLCLGHPRIFLLPFWKTENGRGCLALAVSLAEELLGVSQSLPAALYRPLGSSERPAKGSLCRAFEQSV